MKYLIKTSELLFDPSFFRLAAIWNEGFIMLDQDLYAAMSTTENAFHVDAKNWFVLCNNTKTLCTFGGYAIPFVVYAGKHIQSMITAEWVTFENTAKGQREKEREKSVREFLDEVKQLKDAIPNKAYLETIQKFMYETLDSIESHYKQLSLTINSTTDMEEQPQRSKLKWRGDASVLCALFLDLRNKDMRRSDEKYLLAGDEDLINFIEGNFVFYDKDNNSVDVPRKTIERYVKGDDMATRIGLDFSKLRR